MDPVGPWSAYASYNRLAGVQPGASTGDLHHHLTGSTATGSPATTTTQILPGGFLSPPPVGYEVFSPLFHPTTKPAAHYVNQHRQALAQAQAAAASASKQGSDGEYHGQAQTFFEQGPTPWQQNSPFGILPHESVVTTTKAGPYENFNAHFAAQSLNQLVATNSKNVRPRSPQVTTATTKASSTQQNSSTFFQGPSTYSAESPNNTKTFSTANTANLQQTCIVTSPTNTSVSKDYRVPQVPNRSVFPATSPSRTVEKSFPSAGNVKQSQQPPPQIQTKAQTKIYPELANQTERQRNSEENQSQSSPISYTMDNSRLNYAGNNVSNKRNQFQHSNYRHYQQQGSESDFQRPKAGSDYALSNGPDSAAIPRKQSPLQAHSQASPIGHAQSPAYPMYNSPMNSISSPQQSNNQVTPPSPLDVSVSRGNSQTSSVAYPSVITRALNNEKNYGERYERPGNQSGNNQNCWDERRKYQPQNAQNNYIPGSMEMNRSTDPQQPNRATLVNVTDRQQAYFDNNHQVTMADLSSCRGDPMSIVKNLQQSCQVQLPEIKQEEKVNVKRRKSGDKGGATALTEGGPPPMDYFPSPIPPPAHSSGANQQQQNGSYFDFDRWNLPNPNTKLFGSQGLHQQHQGLMVPHPHSHPPPPLPYFPPFHLPHHSAEYPSSVELTPLSTYSEQSPQPTTSQFPPQDDQPKVVVPNIEEELNYLAEDNIVYKTARASSSSNPNSACVRPTVVNKKTDKISGPGVGFMNSYLKFLQGDKDSSPPPASRGNRKQSWTKTKTIVTPPPPPATTTAPDIKPTNTNTNGIVSRPPPIAAPILTPRLSQGDPQDDPRYFPLPKERKKNSFDSSDDGVSSDDEFFHHKKAVPPPVKVENPPPAQPPKEKEKQKRKGRPPKVGEEKAHKPASEKKKPKAEKQNKQANSDGTKPKREPRAEPVPKRESSKRAAKERSNIKLIAKREEEADENDFIDSDSDPAWTPQCKDDPEPDVMMKKSKRGRPGRKRNLRNLLSTAAEGAGIHDISDSSNDITQIKKQKTSTKKENQNKSSDQSSESNTAPSLTQKNLPTMSEDNFFKPGEFVVIKSELSEEWPAIWRVDGKTLLQKYEPFEQNGQTLYRNISTYTSWTPESKKQYMSVPVKYRSQSHLETIVEFLRNEMTVVDHAFMDKVMKENEVYQDNFEVYIQTLISQALDSNFLTEIFQEQDDYFLSNVQTIDDITRSKKQKLLTLLKWPHPVQIAVSTWPCFNIIRELSTPDFQSRNCAACQQSGVSVRVLMYGQPYNSTTLEGCQPDPQAANEKDFLMCRICSNRVQLLNKISHQKYLMYIECAKRVADKRSTDAHKDTTCILNELLADEPWLNQLFLDVRNSWGEVDSLEHNYKQRNSKSQ